MYDDRRLTGGLGADGRDEAVGKEEAMQKETVYEAVGLSLIHISEPTRH